MGLMRLSMLSMMSLFDQICDYYYDGTISFSTGTPEPLSFDGIGYSLVYLACETVVYLVIAILLLTVFAMRDTGNQPTLTYGDVRQLLEQQKV